MKKPPAPVATQAGKIEFLRTNADNFGWRDVYRTVLPLSWPRFALVVLTVYLALNLIFAAAYLLGGNCIDETSPLYGVAPEQLEITGTRFMTSIVCIDTVIQAPVQSQTGYIWSDVRFGQRFVEIYKDQDDGRLEVDYGRVHETEPVPDYQPFSSQL